MSRKAETLSLDMEQSYQAHALWLAGLFEVSGSFGFLKRTYHPTGARTAYPNVLLGDNSLPRIQIMKQLFGGIITKGRTKNSFRWQLTGEKTLPLVDAIRAYSPSRQEVIAAFLNWANSSAEERFQIAEEMTNCKLGRNHRGIVSADQFHPMTSQPQFIAGSFDSRGYLHSEQATIQISTVNRPLLESLQKQYGGTLKDIIAPNRPVEICGNLCVTKSETTKWSLSGQESRNFLAMIYPYLLMRTQEAERFLS